MTTSQVVAQRKPMERIDFIFHVLQTICLFCGALQLIIDPTVDGIVCDILVVASTSAVIQYLRISRAPMEHPVSTLAMLGLCTTAQFASLVAQTLYWNPISFMLRVPIYTFSILAGVQFLAILAHLCVSRIKALNQVRGFFAERIVLPLGGFSVPSVGSIWALAFFGALAAFFTGAADTGNVGGKLFEALSFLAYLPFMIPLYYMSFSERYCSIRRQGALVLVYAILLVLIGIARNVRSLVLVGPVQALFIYLIYSLQNPKPITRNSIKKMFIGLVLGVVALQLAADLATAMALSRAKRRTASPFEMVAETIETLGDRSRMDVYRQSGFDDARHSNYDEAYIPNPVLTRFSETKFHDNMLFFSTRLSESAKDDLRQIVVEKIALLLPQNILGKLHINLDKNRYYFSMGDYYVAMNGNIYAYGSFLTGSIWADIVNIFGYWSPVFVFGMMVVSFILLDSLSRPKVGVVNISPAVLCASWIIFIYGLGGESLPARIGLSFREIPQRLLLFVAAYWFIALFSKPAVKVDGVSVHMNPAPVATNA